MMLKKKKARLVADALGHAKASTTIDEIISDFIGNKNPSDSDQSNG